MTASARASRRLPAAGRDRAAVDVVVVGSGPNGLAAAVTLARAGLEVVVLEAEPVAGGGTRTLDLGLAPGIVHDLCSAVHPLAWASPFFRELDLAARGVELLTPEISYGQPLDPARPGRPSRAALAHRDLARTVEGLGADGAAWRRIVGSLAGDGAALADVVLGDRTLGALAGAVRGDGARRLLRTALGVASQGSALWNLPFRGDAAPALLTGVAAHAMVRQPSPSGAGVALLLAALAHGEQGWPVPRGGSAAIGRALVADLEAHGGTVRTDTRVSSVADLPPARAVLFDTTPRTLLRILGDRLPARARSELRRFPYGPGVAKVDLVTDGPVPWAAAGLERAGTVHLGGTRADVARAEADVARGRHAEHPVVLVSDPSVVDPGRRAGGLRPVWAYAHVPAGSTLDPVPMVTAEIERFAPGFADTVVAARGLSAARLPEHDENYVGGDIGAGAISLLRVAARPSLLLPPYGTGLDHVYLCSASTPPGPGVHGLAGWYAARRVLRRTFGIRRTPSLAPAPSP